MQGLTRCTSKILDSFKVILSQIGIGCKCSGSLSSSSTALLSDFLDGQLDEEVFICRAARLRPMCKSRCSFNRGGKVGPSLAGLLHIYDPKLLWDPASLLSPC